MAGNGIQPEQEQQEETHVLPSSGSLHPDASSNSEPNPPSTPLSTIPPLTRDKTPATSCNLLSWFRHPLATFTASLKRRRDEAAETKALQEKKKKTPGSGPELLAESIPKTIAGATTTAHIVDCLDHDHDVDVKKEDMAIAGKEEKVKAKEQQGSPRDVVEKKWVEEPIDITGGNSHKVSITLPNNKQPESAAITVEEAAAAHPAAAGLKMNQQLAAGIQDEAENAEEAAPATEDTAVSGIREIK